MADSTDVLGEIVMNFRLEGLIDGGIVRRWMQSDYLEVMGAVYVLVREDRFAKRISPPLEDDEYRRFVPRFLFRCLAENSDTEWTLERYEAGIDLANWFIGLWHDKSIPRSYLSELRLKLGKLFLEADESFRRSIIEAPIKQIFEFREMRDYFESWKSHAILNLVHDDVSRFK